MLVMAFLLLYIHNCTNAQAATKPTEEQHHHAVVPTGGAPLTVVRGLDVARYMGRWYEIASMPSFFQPQDGAATTVDVLNETWSKGTRVARRTPYRADPASDEAKLKFRLCVPPFLPVVGDYWVLYVDGDYQYELVEEPRRKYLWILCRKTRMDEALYSRLVEKAKEEGCDVTKLRCAG